MLAIILPLLTLQTPPPAPNPVVSAPAKPLGFFSQKFPYKWDEMLPLKGDLDGLKLNSIFFNHREVDAKFLRGTHFGTRAKIEVTNTSTKRHSPNFALAVFDDEERLLGVATGGCKLTGISPGETETFDLEFSRVLARLEKGTHYVLSVEMK